MELRKSQKVLGVVGASLIAAAGALTIAAKRERVSRRGWFVTHVIIPVVFRGKGGGIDGLYKLIARDRATGAALPSRRVRSKNHFVDGETAGCRAFRLRRSNSASPPLRILYLHGGAYVFDLVASQWQIMTRFVDRLDVEVVAPIYPLAPEYQVEAALTAVETVYHSLVDEVGGDNIVIAGDSAGGGLALALAHRLLEKGAAIPRGLLLYFPWLDVSVCGVDQPEIEKSDPILSIDLLREAGRSWSGGDLDDKRASPLFAEHKDLPPVLIMVGTKDLLVSDARRLIQEHPSATLLEFPGMFHGFVCTPIPEAKRALDVGAEFIARGTGAVP